MAGYLFFFLCVVSWHALFAFVHKVDPEMAKLSGRKVNSTDQCGTEAGSSLTSFPISRCCPQRGSNCMIMILHETAACYMSEERSLLTAVILIRVLMADLGGICEDSQELYHTTNCSV